MILYIDTTDNEEMVIALFEAQGKSFGLVKEKKISAKRQQAEKLLPSISKLLLSSKCKLSDLDIIAVNNNGGSFTSLRIGVLTANALAYAVGIEARSATIRDGKLIIGKKSTKKFSDCYIVEPVYSSEPNIGKKKISASTG